MIAARLLDAIIVCHSVTVMGNVAKKYIVKAVSMAKNTMSIAVRNAYMSFALIVSLLNIRKVEQIVVKAVPLPLFHIF